MFEYFAVLPRYSVGTPNAATRLTGRYEQKALRSVRREQGVCVQDLACVPSLVLGPNLVGLAQGPFFQ